MARTCGRISTYRTGCRCPDCRAANARSVARFRANPPPVKEHGTVYAYRMLGCRCDVCRAANAEYQREYRARVRMTEATNDTERT